jgi:hypothetical protein
MKRLRRYQDEKEPTLKKFAEVVLDLEQPGLPSRPSCDV